MKNLYVAVLIAFAAFGTKNVEAFPQIECDYEPEYPNSNVGFMVRGGGCWAVGNELNKAFGGAPPGKAGFETDPWSNSGISCHAAGNMYSKTCLKTVGTMNSFDWINMDCESDAHWETGEVLGSQRFVFWPSPSTHQHCKDVAAKMNQMVAAQICKDGLRFDGNPLGLNPVGTYQADGTCDCTDPNAAGPACEFSNSLNCKDAGVAQADGTCNCNKGHFQDSSSSCTTCPSKTFQAQDDYTGTSCEAIDTCGAGQGEDAAPTPSSDRTCKACAAGTQFSAADDEGSSKVCKAVVTCGAGTEEDAAPTTSSDRTCKACTAGVTFSAGNGACVAVTINECGAGAEEDAAPTTSSDRTCKACIAGTTFSAAGVQEYKLVNEGNICDYHFKGLANPGRQACADACRDELNCMKFSHGPSALDCRYSSCGAGDDSIPCPDDKQCPIGNETLFLFFGTNAGANVYEIKRSSMVCKAVATCGAGTEEHAAPTASSDRACKAISCAVDEFVSGKVCTACLAGTTNAKGDDASGDDTTCDATLCAVDEFVLGKVCTACLAGTTNAKGDDASGDDTTCDATMCAVNEFVEVNACTTCPVGSTNPAGDDASKSNTVCTCTDPAVGVGPTCQYSNAETCSDAGVAQADGTCICNDPNTVGPACKTTVGSTDTTADDGKTVEVKTLHISIKADVDLSTLNADDFKKFADSGKEMAKAAGVPEDQIAEIKFIQEIINVDGTSKVPKQFKEIEAPTSRRARRGVFYGAITFEIIFKDTATVDLAVLAKEVNAAIAQGTVPFTVDLSSGALTGKVNKAEMVVVEVNAATDTGSEDDSRDLGNGDLSAPGGPMIAVAVSCSVVALLIIGVAVWCVIRGPKKSNTVAPTLPVALPKEVLPEAVVPSPPVEWKAVAP